MPTSHDSGVGIDPAFLALPLSKLSSTALQRARDFNATHADFRVERLRTQDLSLRDGSLVDSSEGDDVGFAVRVVDRRHLGLRVRCGTHRRRGRASHRAGSPGRDGGQGDRARTHRAGRRAGLPGRRLGLGVRRRPVRRAARPTRSGCSRSGATGCCAAAGVDHVSADAHQVRENKFYADSHGTTTTQQRVRIYPQLEIVGADHDKGILDSMRTIAPPVGRGWEYLTDGGLRLGRRAGGAPRPAGGQARGAERRGRQLRPGGPPQQPVADDPREHRPRHRARPSARLRGELRRHVVRHHRQARHPAVRLAST